MIRAIDVRPAVVLVAKLPVIGRVKTRLSPPLSKEQAHGLYTCMLQDTIDTLGSLPDANLYIAFNAADCGAGRPRVYDYIQVPDAYKLLDQGCGDLGARLKHLSEEVLAVSPCALFIGADSPDLPRAYLSEAIASLNDHDVVIGPSADGGYYLIGIHPNQSFLFDGISWSNDTVFEQTVEKARRHALTVGALPPWRDVDMVADVQELRQRLRRDRSAAPRTAAYIESLPEL